MNMNFSIFILALIAGLSAGYTTRVLARTPSGVDFIRTQNIIILSIGAIATPAILSVIVWGFIYLPWWWVVLSFVGVSLVIVPVLFGGVHRLPFLIKIQPVQEFIAIASALFLWIIVLN